MNLFPYLFILTLASIIYFNKSNFISSFNDGLLWDNPSILLPKRSLGTNLSHGERRIFGGKYVTHHRKYPYMAYLLRVTLKKKINKTISLVYKSACGATILSTTYALSAANCFRKCSCVDYTDDADEQCKPKCIFYGADNYTLYAGDKVANNSVMLSKLKNIYIHPEHKFVDTTHKCLHRYDIAVMELATPLTFGEKVMAVALPKPVTGLDNLNSTFTSEFFNKENVECYILGWGYTEEIERFNHTKYTLERLKVAKVHLIGLDKCESELTADRPNVTKDIPNYVCSDTDICSKSARENSICSGDSGGPIICDGVQVGISSWSRVKCMGKHSLSIYTRVEVCIQWINDIMSGNNRQFLKP